MNDRIVAQIRTTVPVLVAATVAWLASRFGIVIDEGTSALVQAAVISLLTAGYYALARKLETIPAFRWVLGVARPPTYTETVPR